MTTDRCPTLRHADPAALGCALDATVALLTDLSLTGKHAYWNVQGPGFRALHRQLAELGDEWSDAADAVTERAVMLGYAPDRRAATITARSPLPQLAAGPQQDAELIVSLSQILTEAAAIVRERMDRLDDVDALTADLLHSVAAALEQQASTVRATADAPSVSMHR